MNTFNTTPRSVRGFQTGRTLLELMISIALGLVVVGAMLAIYQATNTSSRHSATESRMSQDAAIALQMIGDQVRMAGFSLPRAAVSSGGATVDGALMSMPDRNFTGAGIRGCDHGFSTLAADFDALTCNTAGSAAFAVRFEGAHPTDPSADLLPASADCLSQAVTATTVGALGSGFRLVESRYFLGAGSDLSCAGNGSAVAFASQPFFQSVEVMSVRYGVASDASSSDVQAYMTASEVDALGGSVDQRWSRVVTMELCLLMQGTQRESLTGSSYVDCSGTVVTPTVSDGLMRRAYKTVFALRNRGGFAVAP